METIYFDKTGKENTEETLRLAKKAAQEEDIDTLVLASTTGYTAEKAIDICQGLKLIVVGIDRDKFPKELIERLEKQGGKVYFSHEQDYDYPQNMQTAFRRFSQGTKVSVENVVIATKENSLESGKRVVSLAGTHWGADTALVIRAAKEFSQIIIEKLVCKPWQTE